MNLTKVQPKGKDLVILWLVLFTGMPANRIESNVLERRSGLYGNAANGSMPCMLDIEQPVGDKKILNIEDPQCTNKG